MIFDKFAIYAVDKKVFGKIVEYSELKGEATIQDNDGKLYKSRDFIVLEKIGMMDGTELFSGDVIKDENFQFEIELLEDGAIQCHVVDGMYDRTGKSFKTTKEKLLNSGMEIVGNIYELRDKLPKVDFDVKTVKTYDGTKYTYYYALNNKEKKEVDLIKATFFGAKAISNEEYERKTMTYVEYLEAITNGTLKEVSEQEFSNFVLGVAYGAKKLNDKLQEMMASKVTKDDFEDDYEVDDFEMMEDEWDMVEAW